MIEQISQALTEAIYHPEETAEAQWLRPYEPGEELTIHQFALFLKPETTLLKEGVRTEQILRIIFEALEQWQVEVGAVGVLTSKYLLRHQVMDSHYGVIANISRNGAEVISQQARQTLEDKFADQLAAGVKLLGGHQFLNQFPEFSAKALSVFTDNIGPTKLAGGTYCIPLKVEGQMYLVLNPFYPHMLDHYTAKDRAIILLEGLSTTPWVDLRQKLAGATDPTQAAPGSIRQILLDRHEEVGMAVVNQGANGIHLSAGPLEGMVEVQRFFSDYDKGERLPFDQTRFGRLLLEKGISRPVFDQLAANADIQAGDRVISAFDLTEEMDADEAVETLRQHTGDIVAE